jgi:hypothetical protein
MVPIARASGAKAIHAKWPFRLSFRMEQPVARNANGPETKGDYVAFDTHVLLSSFGQAGVLFLLGLAFALALFYVTSRCFRSGAKRSAHVLEMSFDCAFQKEGTFILIVYEPPQFPLNEKRPKLVGVSQAIAKINFGFAARGWQGWIQERNGVVFHRIGDIREQSRSSITEAFEKSALQILDSSTSASMTSPGMRCSRETSFIAGERPPLIVVTSMLIRADWATVSKINGPRSCISVISTHGRSDRRNWASLSILAFMASLA